ncbi:uncharacterized protein LOC111116648 [Crassostrea virginica]
MKKTSLTVILFYLLDYLNPIESGGAPVDPVTPAPTTTTTSSHSEESLTTEHKIIIGVCVSAFVLIIVAVITILLVKKLKANSSKPEPCQNI